MKKSNWFKNIKETLEKAPDNIGETFGKILTEWKEELDKFSVKFTDTLENLFDVFLPIKDGVEEVAYGALNAVVARSLARIMTASSAGPWGTAAAATVELTAFFNSVEKVILDNFNREERKRYRSYLRWYNSKNYNAAVDPYMFQAYISYRYTSSIRWDYSIIPINIEWDSSGNWMQKG